MVKDGSYQGLGAQHRRLLARADKAAHTGAGPFSKAKSCASMSSHSKAGMMVKLGIISPPPPPLPPSVAAATAKAHSSSSSLAPPPKASSTSLPVVTSKAPGPVTGHSSIIERIELQSEKSLACVTFFNEQHSRYIASLEPSEMVVQWDLSSIDPRQIYLRYAAATGTAADLERYLVRLFRQD